MGIGRVLLTAAALAVAASAFAAEGVTEIDQPRALAGGINGSLVDDPPGFPVVITFPGSYRLTGNLTLPDGNTTAIQILVEDVVLDLGGFEIRGPNSCSAPPVSCTASGTGFGVQASTADVRVANGTVRGVGSTGVLVGDRGRVERVLAIENGGGFGGGNGIDAGAHCLISESVAERNLVVGITGGRGCRIERNAARQNGYGGILAGDAATLRGNTTGANADFGLSAGSGSLATRNTALQNGGTGITVLERGQLRDSTAMNNGKCGLAAGRGSLVAGNVSFGNAISPLHFMSPEAESGFEWNSIGQGVSGFSFSVQSGAVPLDLDHNHCLSSSGCGATPLTTGACP
jgi:hypothetical protein